MSARGFFLGAAVAAGALLLVPGVANAVGRVARPVLRKGMKAGAEAYDEARRTAARAYEDAEDIWAEVQADMNAEETGAATGPEGTAASPPPGKTAG